MRRVAILLSFAALLAMPLLLGAGANSPMPEVFVVNTAADHDDGSCDSSDCTLREAISASNANPGVDHIHFSIPGTTVHTITPGAELPEITDPVIIDGSSQPGFAGAPRVEVAGSAASSRARGLFISAGGSTIKHLAINRFSSAQIMLSANGGNVIQGNNLGTDPTGTVDYGGSIGNDSSHGLVIEGSSANLVGGPDRGDGNIIAFNTSAGVLITGGGSVGNAILSNSIHSNGGLGIDLSETASGGPPDGVTPNEGCDGDEGPNRLQNFPELTSARTNGVTITISGVLPGTAATTHTIQFFSSDEFDFTGFGEGRTFLGSTTAADDKEHPCFIEYEVTLPFFAFTGQVITATATDPDGNTSEFARYLEIVEESTFDSCIQDGSNGSVLLFDSETGDYQFSDCDGFLLSGRGTLARRGGTITLQHNAPDRRISARLDGAVRRATASVQSFAHAKSFALVDKNTGDNTCACSEE
ncbi:MAG TPA: CSLREA domain-containing protein [Blastocatellia bacterium]|nr:CSLREA domain-containing protein [Blastocatellia bacterium]